MNNYYLKYKKYKKKYLNLLHENNIAGADQNAAAEQPILEFDVIDCNKFTSYEKIEDIKKLIFDKEKNITDKFIFTKEVGNTIETSIHYHTDILCSMGASKRIYYGIRRFIRFEGFDLNQELKLIEANDEPIAIHEILTNDDRLLNELNIYFKLDHENILKPYHIKKTQEKLYMYSKIGKNVLDVTMNNIFSFIKQMLSGLSYLHSQNPPIIHRDFKLGNIIKINDTYKIIDFGLSTKFIPSVAPPVDPTSARPKLIRQTSVEKKDGTFTGSLGTRNYWAPELYVLKDVEYTEKTDTYALGITIINIIRNINKMKHFKVGPSYQLHILSISKSNLGEEEKKQMILKAEFYKLTCIGNLLVKDIPTQPTFINDIDKILGTTKLREFLTDCLLNVDNRLTPTELLKKYNNL